MDAAFAGATVPLAVIAKETRIHLANRLFSLTHAVSAMEIAPPVLIAETNTPTAVPISRVMISVAFVVEAIIAPRKV